MKTPKIASKNRRVSSETAGIIFAFLATIVWSGNFIIGRELADTVSPVTLSICRWSIAFLAVFPFSLSALMKDRHALWRHKIYYCIISLIGVSLFNTLIYYAAHKVAALNMSLIAITAPLFTIVLARIIYGESIRQQRLAGICVVLVGVVALIAKGDLKVLASLSFQPEDLLMLAAAFSFSVYTLLLRKKTTPVSQSSFLSCTFGLGLLFLLPVGLWEWAQGETVEFSFPIVWRLFYVGLGTSLFSFWCWGRAIHHIGPSRASIIYYSLPLFCGIEAVIFLHEPVQWIHAVSGCLIAAGLFLATKEPKMRSLRD